MALYPQGPTYTEDQIIDEFWVDLKNRTNEGKAIIYRQEPKQGSMPWDRPPYDIRHVVTIIEPDGRVYDTYDDGTRRFIRVEPGYVRDPRLREDPYGNVQREDPATGQWSPAPGMPVKTPVVKTPEEIAKDQADIDYLIARIKKMYAELPTEEERKLALEGLRAKIEAHRRTGTRTPAQEAADLAQARLYGAHAGKAEQDLMNPYVLQRQRIDEAINIIKEQMARGEIDEAQGNQMMDTLRANLNAALKGTTPWQMEEDTRTREQAERTTRQKAAQDVLNTRSQLAGSIAPGFLTGLGDMYGKVRAGNFQGNIINPLEMTNAYVDQFGPGPETSGLAQSLIRMLLRPQGLQPQGGM